MNSFWEDAWLESVFKMKMLQRNGVQPATGWIEKEINSWVQESFAIEDLSVLTSVEAETETDPKVDFIELNLKDYLKAPLDIYASYASGEEIIPLFHWPSLQDERKQTVQEILRRHDIFHEPPQRMPVL